MNRLVTLIFVSVLAVLAAAVQAQGMITTVAGGGPNNMPALSANLNEPTDVAVDGVGNQYIVAPGQNRVFKVDTAGKLTVFAGNAFGFSGDGGPASAASLAEPSAVALDSSGNLYIADSGNSRIRRVDAATGVITTVAGNGTYGFSGDGGPATAAELKDPGGVGVDSGGNLYIADRGDSRIRRVDAATGIITTVAGNGSPGFGGDGGLATAATLASPSGVALDSSGNLYIADTLNQRVRRVDAVTGIITTVAGNGSWGYSGDGGPATAARLFMPSGVALDGAGNLYIADTGRYRLADSPNYRIRRVDAATGIITTVAGNGTYAFSGDGGAATAASLAQPLKVTVNSSGDLYIADTDNNRIRKVVAATGIITTVAGNGTRGFSGDDGPALVASLYNPNDVALDSGGNLYISDYSNNRVRRVDSSGIITTVAGNGSAGSGGDGGLATAASLSYPEGVAVDSGGNLLIADYYSYRIRRVDAATRIIATVAGNGTPGFSGDGGPATAAQLYNPGGVAVDGGGNLYIADSGNARIRRVDAASGVITSVAGNGTTGFSGDGGLATAAGLSASGVALDSSGNIYIADSMNQRIRRVDATTRVITTVAGNGTPGYGGDGGPATAASLYRPSRVTVDGSGNLYIADYYNQRIRRVDAATGIITTVAGNGTYGFSGDGGSATAASLAYPAGAAVDGSGQLYIADEGNGRVRMVMTAAGALNKLAGNIANSGLPAVIRASMAARLGTAKNKVSDNNPNNDAAACGILGSIVNQITAMQKSGKLAAVAADSLRRSADTARVAAGCR